MNFLSHYYFNRYSTDPEFVLGSVLPDLLRQLAGGQRLHPDRFELEWLGNPRLQSLYAGWNQHVEIDRRFHNTEFFFQHTHELRVVLAPLLEDSPIRASFLSHIAVELLLDHLLLRDEVVEVQRFYHLLERADRGSLERFLRVCGWQDVEGFFRFFDHFLRTAYLKRYKELGELIPALTSICQRVWNLPGGVMPASVNANVLQFYVDERLSSDYLRAFDEVDNFS